MSLGGESLNFEIASLGKSQLLQPLKEAAIVRKFCSRGDIVDRIYWVHHCQSVHLPLLLCLRARCCDGEQQTRQEIPTFHDHSSGTPCLPPPRCVATSGEDQVRIDEARADPGPESGARA